MQYSIAHATCKKKDSTSKQGSRIMHMQQRQGHKIIKFDMHTCHAGFTCRTYKERCNPKIHYIEAPNRYGMGTFCSVLALL